MDYPKSLPGIGLVGGKFADANPVTGTPGSWISAAWANSLMDELLGIIDAAGFTPSEVDNGQVLKAIRALAMPIYLTAPADNVGPLVYVIDRQQILHWQTVGTFTGYVSPNVGRFVWGTSTSPRPDEVDAIGQTVDRTNPRFQALIAWAESNGHMVSSDAWTKGAFQFSVISGNNVRMPDLRDQFIRATGTDADTANARTLGSTQRDALQALAGAIEKVQIADGGGVATGVFGLSKWSRFGVYETAGTLPGQALHNVEFDASKTARTSNETRPSNFALHPRIQI